MKFLRQWLVLAIAITVGAGTLYIVAQQNLRREANHPQIQIAEDVALELSGGANPSQLDTQNRTDIGKSLVAYLIVYDDAGKAIASTAQLNGQVPAVPLGVLQTSKKSGENRITWRPQSGVRSALVIVPFSSTTATGYVVVGRSLREIESTMSALLRIIAIGWGIAMILTLLATGLLKKYMRKPGYKEEEPEKEPEMPAPVEIG